MAGRRKVKEVWLANDLDPAPIVDEIVELATEDRVPIREVSRGKLDAEARTDAPQGVLAHAAELQPVELEGLARAVAGRPAPFLLALDSLTDPGNLGALLRSAECAGVTGVVMPRHRAAHVTASVTKAAAGAVEHLPMALVSGIPSALAQLRGLGVWSIGLDAAADRNLWELELAAEPVVLVLGAEGKGLSRLARDRCDQLASIPMAGRLESLNVATAGALACYEIVRRRSLG